MVEVFAEYAPVLTTANGLQYRARALGTDMDDGRWKGWLEFEPLAEGPVLQTPDETTQPNRDALSYWAFGLTPIYLEGALDRALRAAGLTLEPEIAHDIRSRRMRM
jgi:hypothetical protein